MREREREGEKGERESYSSDPPPSLYVASGYLRPFLRTATLLLPPLVVFRKDYFLLFRAASKLLLEARDSRTDSETFHPPEDVRLGVILGVIFTPW